MLATLMLTTPQAGVLSVASAEEVTLEEDAILQMEPVKDEDEPMVDPVPDEVLPLVEEAADTEELTSAESEAEGRDAANEYTTPVMDLSTAMVDKQITTNRSSILLSLSVSNPESVSWLEIEYCLRDDYSVIYPVRLYYDSYRKQFTCWYSPSVYGEYEMQQVHLGDRNGEQQTVYNAASSNTGNIPDDAVTYDLSALNFSVIDDYIYTMDELKSAVAAAKEGDWLWISGAEDFVLDESVTIPQGVYLNVQSGAGSFKVAEGTTLTTNNKFDCYVPMIIDGTWKANGMNWGDLNLTVSANGTVESKSTLSFSLLQIDGYFKNSGTISIRDNLSVSSTGLLENGGIIYTGKTWKIDGVIKEIGAGAVYYDYSAKTMDDLMSFVNLAKAGDTITIDLKEREFLIDDSITIPDGVRIEMPYHVTICENVVLSTYTAQVQSMTVAGTWQIRDNARCWNELSISSTGGIENNGYLEIAGSYENNGTLTTAPTATTKVSISVTSLEELEATLSNDRSILWDIRWGVAENTVISKDITIPAGYTVNIYNNSDATLTIDSGITFTNNAEIDCSVPATVKGTWINNGNAYFSNLKIAEDGHIQNNSYLQISDSYENHGTLTTAPSATTRLFAHVYNFEDLKRALASKIPSEMTIYLHVTGTLTLTEDITVPENISLLVFGQDNNPSLVVDEGAVLTTNGYFTCEIPMTIAGTWINRYFGVNLQNGLTITSAGKVDNAEGWLQVHGAFVNNGIFTGSNFRQTVTATTPDELKAALDSTYANNGTVFVTGDSDFIIAEDLMIPKGLTVEVYGNIQSLHIAASTTLTIDSEATLRSYVPVLVEGTVVNYGALGIWNGMDVSGKIDNYNYIRVAEGELTGEDKIIEHEASTCSVYREYLVDSEESLHSILDNLDLQKWNNLVVSDDLTLSEDVTIPEGVYMNIQAGTFTVGKESTLVTYNNLHVRSDMIVGGHWENRAWPVNFYSPSCTLSGALEINGSVTNRGYILVYSCAAAKNLDKINNVDAGEVYGYINVYSLDALSDLFSYNLNSKMAVSLCINENITFDKDLIVPANIWFEIQSNSETCNIIIPSGVTVTLNDFAVVPTGPVNIDVQGTIIVNNYCCNFDQITVSGILENRSSINFNNLIIQKTGTVKNSGILCGNISNSGKIEKTKHPDEEKVYHVTLYEPCNWEDIFSNIQSGDTVYVTCEEDAYVSIDIDTTLPQNLNLGINSLRIQAGAVLTSSSEVSFGNLTVDGIWNNNGTASVCTISGSGRIENNGSLQVLNPVESTYIAGKAVLPWNDEDFDASLDATILNLQEVLNHAESGSLVQCSRHSHTNEETIIINSDTLIPQGVSLRFIDGTSKVYLTKGSTLTVNGTLIVDQQMYFKGDFVLNGCIQVSKTDNRNHSVSDPFSLLNGLEKDNFTVWDTGDSWLIASKSKANLFCEVQNSGCTLRLLDGDNCVWTTVALSSGTVIPDIKAGRYTLEVSKAGYVTRRYTVDTSAMPETLSIELVETGNVNGATNPLGYAVDASDMQCLYELLTTGDCLSQIDDPEYFKAVADVNGDGTADVYDLQLLYEAVSGISKL